VNPNLKDSIDDLTPQERRDLGIAQTAATLVRGLLHEQITKIESGAAEAAEDTSSEPDAKPVMAKVSVTIEWEAGANDPELNASLTYSVRRKFTGSLRCDPNQLKLSIEGGV
tara:strand:- start:24 stop:359 length:336 start_codon:yes stop_codon:yes gene_type:complete